MITTPSILLRSRDVGEADRIYTFYTRDHGKIEARATGVRKIKSKLAGHCVPNATIRCTFFPGRREMRLVQATALTHYPHIVRDFFSYGVAAYAREAVDVMTKSGVSDAVIFDLLVRLFDGLIQQKTASHLLLQAFLFHFLTALGYRPRSRNVIRDRVVPTLLRDHITEPLESEQFLAFMQAKGGA
ncbi:MAG: DNA repair protein RecO [bacterium]|nr:DNA repair protein RecO [bacterium]